jgi:hypothetical protein
MRGDEARPVRGEFDWSKEGYDEYQAACRAWADRAYPNPGTPDYEGALPNPADVDYQAKLEERIRRQRDDPATGPLLAAFNEDRAEKFDREGWSDAIDAVNGSAGDPGVAAAGRQARRVEQAAEVRAGAEASPLAVQVADILRGLLAGYQTGGSDMAVPRSVPGVPSAFWVTGLRDDRTVVVHVMEVNR